MRIGLARGRRLARTAVVVLPILLAAVALVLIFWKHLPTFSLYNVRVEYAEETGLSPRDFAQIVAAVPPHVGRFEWITAVAAEDKTSVRVTTLERYEGPLAASGHWFILSRQGDKWVVTRRGFWLS